MATITDPGFVVSPAAAPALKGALSSFWTRTYGNYLSYAGVAKVLPATSSGGGGGGSSTPKYFWS